MIKTNKFKRLTISALAVLFWIIIWQIASGIINLELILPSPLCVLKRIFELCANKDFYITIIHSIGRVMLGMLAGVLIGALGGALTAFSSFAKSLFSPILAVIKSTPIASFIILLFLWLSRDAVALFISALIVLPIVWSNVEVGLKSCDKSLLEMASAYKIPKSKMLTSIYIPSTLPYFTASLKSSLGMSWKAGIAAEALILPSISIGKQIFEAKYNLETVDLFAWTIVVIILSIIIEKLLFFCLTAIHGGKTNA